MRRPFIAGNWKMNLDKDSAVALAEGLAREAEQVDDRLAVVLGKNTDPALFLGRQTAMHFCNRHGQLTPTVHVGVELRKPA